MKLIKTKLLLLACLIYTGALFSFWGKSDTNEQSTKANKKFEDLLPQAITYMSNTLTPMLLKSKTKKETTDIAEKINDFIEKFGDHCGAHIKRSKVTKFNSYFVLTVELNGSSNTLEATIGHIPPNYQQEIAEYKKEAKNREKKRESEANKKKMLKEITGYSAAAIILRLVYQIVTSHQPLID